MKLRIVTYNIRHGLGDDDVLDLARVRDVLRELDADFLLLQEVDRAFPRSGRVNQAEWLSHELRMEYAYADNYRVDALYGMGNAILSRHPIHSTWNRTLPYTGERRGLLYAEIELGVRRVGVATTHWGLAATERARQAEAVIAELADINGPLLIGGDFNCGLDSPELTRLIDGLGARELTGDIGPTYPASDPTDRLDYIIGRGFDADWAAVEHTPASDHLPVLCDVVLR